MNLKLDEITVLQLLDQAEQDELVTLTKLRRETEIRNSRLSAILIKLEKLGFIQHVTPKAYRKEIPFIAT